MERGLFVLSGSPHFVYTVVSRVKFQVGHGGVVMAPSPGSVANNTRLTGCGGVLVEMRWECESVAEPRGALLLMMLGRCYPTLVHGVEIQ